MHVMAVVDLCRYRDIKSRVKYSHEMDILYYPVRDSSANNVDWAEKVSQFIETSIQNNKKVFVHCYYGISRSATSIIHYLITRLNMSLKDAFDLVKSKRECICPNVGFMKGLCELEMILYGKNTMNPKEYSICSISQLFPDVNREEIETAYQQSELMKNTIATENEDNHVKELKCKGVVLEEIEPIGYLSIELLKEKYQINKRYGCVEHHPFE